ncbi:MAG: VanZ family protein [Bacillus sp. (in: Bacteria)]|nr:VanZ family protein [Bacillus sp. (in: firmicutes)]MCM1425064.1 VanZ family protein [Eubacterium sp.]
MNRIRTIAGVLALLWMCVIFAFSAQEKDESSAVSEAFSYRVVNSTGILFHLHLDEEELRRIAAAIESTVRKAAHMTEFGILSILLYVWLGKWQMATGVKIALAAVISMLYAASDEFHQLSVPGRAGSVGDVMIDSVGAILGVGIFVGVKKCISFLWNRHKSKAIKLS